VRFIPILANLGIEFCATLFLLCRGKQWSQLIVQWVIFSLKLLPARCFTPAEHAKTMTTALGLSSGEPRVQTAWY